MRKSYIAIKRHTTGDNNKYYTRVYMINHDKGKTLFDLVKEVMYYSYCTTDMAVKFNTTSPEEILKYYDNTVDITDMVGKNLENDWRVSDARTMFMGLRSDCGVAVVDITLNILGCATGINYYFMRSKPICLCKEKPYARRYDETDYLKSIDDEYSDFKLKMFKGVVRLVNARCIKESKDIFFREHPHLAEMEDGYAKVR